MKKLIKGYVNKIVVKHVGLVTKELGIEDLDIRIKESYEFGLNGKMLLGVARPEYTVKGKLFSSTRTIDKINHIDVELHIGNILLHDLLVIRKKSFEAAIAETVAHELRHCQQFKKKVGTSYSTLDQSFASMIKSMETFEQYESREEEVDARDYAKSYLINNGMTYIDNKTRSLMKNIGTFLFFVALSGLIKSLKGGRK